jgi:hypothetical protein
MFLNDLWQVMIFSMYFIFLYQKKIEFLTWFPNYFHINIELKH